MGTFQLNPNSTASNTNWTGTPNHPNIHLNLDGFVWPSELDEDDYVESDGSGSVFKVDLDNPPANRVWKKVLIRTAHGVIVAGSQVMKTTLFVDGTAETTKFSASSSIWPAVQGSSSTHLINLTSAQLNSAQLEVKFNLEVSWNQDVRFTGCHIFLFDSDEFGDGGTLAGGLATVTVKSPFNETGDGGALVGGLADPDFIDIVEVGGGAIVGGFAKVTQVFQLTITYERGSISTVLSTELDNLGDDASVISGEIDNSVDLCVFDDVEISVASVASAFNSSSVELFMIEAVDDINFADGDSMLDPASKTLVGVFSIRADTVAQRHVVRSVKLPPTKFKYLITQKTGQTWASSGSILRRLPYKYRGV